jgi:hypothetical protein
MDELGEATRVGRFIPNGISFVGLDTRRYSPSSISDPGRVRLG